MAKTPKITILTVLFFIVSFFFVQKEEIKTKQKILGLRTEITNNQKAVFDWEQILLEKPDYRDGWFQLAFAYYKIGNIEKTKEAIIRAKKLDPANNTTILLEELLGERD